MSDLHMAGNGGSGAVAAHRGYLAQSHFGSLDGLRCLCILAVLWHHSPASGLTQGFRLAERGFVGVDFFFVLSGFLITTLLLREQDRKGRISLTGFYRRRALRILPAYLLLVSTVSAYWILVKGRDELIGLLPYYYLFLANFLQGDIPLLTITWSLSIEEQYYLFWPLCLILLPATLLPRAAVLGALMLVCLTAMLGGASALRLPEVATERAVFRLPGMAYMAILAGSLLAVALHDPRGYRMLAPLCAMRSSPLVMFASLLVYLQFAPVDLTGWPALGMDALMILCIASLVMREDHVVRPLASVPHVARIGQISYGLYLYHLIGLHAAQVLVGRLDLGDVTHSYLVSVLFPILSILLAEISFRFYEGPFLSLRQGRPRQS